MEDHTALSSLLRPLRGNDEELCPIHYKRESPRSLWFFVSDRLQPITMDMSDPTRAVADMLTYDPDEPVKFFVLDRKDGKQLVY
jgi:hypothetical protein